MSLDNRTTLFLQLFMAATLGILAWWLTKSWLEEKEGLLKSAFFAQDGKRLSVIVASRPLDPGTVLTEQVLAAAEVDPTFLPEDAIPASDFSSINGLRIRQPLAEGKPLLYSYIEPTVSERFSDLVKPGERAVTLQVDALSSIEGMIEVGDQVDLLTREQLDHTTTLQVLAESVPVIATGTVRRASPDNPQPVAGIQAADPFYSSLTVVLPNNLAAKALLARENQSLVYLLRSRGDNQPLGFTTIDPESVNDHRRIFYFSGNHKENGQLQVLRLRRNAP